MESNGYKVCSNNDPLFAEKEFENRKLKNVKTIQKIE